MMNIYFILQPKIFIIFVFLLLLIKILKVTNLNVIFYLLNRNYIVLKKFINLLFIYPLLCNFNKLEYFFIKRNVMFIDKLQDRLLIFSWIASKILNKFAFFSLILGLVLFIVNIYIKANIITYTYILNLLFSSFIFLTMAIKICYEKNLFKNLFLKLVLYSLLWINVLIILYVFVKILNHFFVFIFTKLLSIKSRLNKNFNPNNNNPNNPDFNYVYSDLKNKKKKTKKILQERSKEMRDKLLIQQHKKHNMTKDNIDLLKKSSLSSKRGINKSIYIEPRQNINLETQFQRIKSELDAYNIQEKKFKAWSKGRGKDFTYPDEAKQLFEEYSKVLKGLRPHLKSMKKKVQKQLKK